MKSDRSTRQRLQEAVDLFARRWGEMAASWGVSRTAAEIHALLYSSEEPLCTDDVMKRLQVSRGSASMNLRQLMSWGLINRTHRAGDRRDYYVAETDVWQMFQSIVRERRRREVEPIAEAIQRCLSLVRSARGAAGDEGNDETRHFEERLEALRGFVTVMNGVLNQVLASDAVDLGHLWPAAHRESGSDQA